jgi:DNA polymerase-3 subunit epsilon
MPRVTQNTSFWWFVLVCVLFFSGAGLGFEVILWQHLPDSDRLVVVWLIGQHASYLFGPAVVLLVGLGFAVDWVFRLYILPIDRIAEKTGIIFGANPGLRLGAEGGRDMVRLAAAVNKAADRFADLQRSVDGRIQEAGERSEEEKVLPASSAPLR